MSTATILDVARQAGDSAGTVSRVINRHPSVDREIARRVQQAVEALNYSPRQRKASMSALNPLQGMNVLLLMLGMDRSLASLPVVASALHGVEQAIGAAQAHLLIADLPALDRVPEVLRRKRIDTLILKGALQGNFTAQAEPKLVKALNDLPAVWVLGRPQGCQGDIVQVNDTFVGQLAAQHLTTRGHRRLAYVSPKPSHVLLMRRQASFTFFAQQAGATVETYLGDEGSWTFPSPAVEHVELVQDLVDRLLEQRQRATAIFAPDDSVGAMVARALAARGVQLGREMSLMSCNNERSLLMGIYPTLTTIDVHAHEIGCRAVDQLAWRQSHREHPDVDICLEPRLIEGASVAKR
jgi:DNA-binding LacI/PurR family transcriptional regulator